MSTLSLPQLIRALTAAGVADEATIHTFIQEFSALIEGALARGENITIKSLGTFGVTWIAGEPTVNFAPDATLATTVNAPFAIFEPVELPSNLSDTDIENTDVESDLTSGNTLESGSENVTAAREIVPPPIPLSHPTPQDAATTETAHPTDISLTPEREPEQVDKTETVAEPEYVPEGTLEPEQAPQPAYANETATGNESPQVEKIIEHEHVIEVHNSTPHHTLHILLASLLSLVVGVITGYLITSHLNFNNVKSVNIEAEGVNVISRTETQNTTTQPAEESELAANYATANPITSADESTTHEHKHENTVSTTKIITDTVRGNRYLTTMARDHYGKKLFWVYIYEENKNIISDPDNIASNTVVIIPPADKYGIKLGDKQSEADAQRRAEAILNSQK